MPDYLVAIGLLWAVWIASWVIAAAFADRPVKRSGLTFLPLGVVVAGMAILSRSSPAFEDRTLWTLGEDGGWAMFALALAGFCFAWWARLALGRLWSGNITLKSDHHIVDTGPYGIVRHPIYTGLLLSAFASAVAYGHMSGIGVAAIVLVSFYIKAAAEERFLARELGADAYAPYRARVPMLLPFGRK